MYLISLFLLLRNKFHIKMKTPQNLSTGRAYHPQISLSDYGYVCMKTFHDDDYVTVKDVKKTRKMNVSNWRLFFSISFIIPNNKLTFSINLILCVRRWTFDDARHRNWIYNIALCLRWIVKKTTILLICLCKLQFLKLILENRNYYFLLWNVKRKDPQSKSKRQY